MTIQINRLDHDGTQLDQTTQQTMPCQKQHDPTTKSSSNDIILNRRQHEKNNIHALGHAKLCFQNHLLVRRAAKGMISLRAPSLCSPSPSHPRADTYTLGCKTHFQCQVKRTPQPNTVSSNAVDISKGWTTERALHDDATVVKLDSTCTFQK